MSDTVSHSLSGRTVLITGGAGFIGSRLAATLVGDNDVRVLDDLSTGGAEKIPDGATFIEGDIRDPETVREAMREADVTFHEAANPSVERSIEDPLGSHSRNIEGTVNVLETAREVGSRVVTASSTAIYGAPETIPVSEDARPTPSSPYGLEKLTVDRYTRLYNDLYGLPTVSLRYFNVYGPGQTGGDYSGVIDVFLEQARSDEPVTVHGDGEQTRDFVHVSDVVRANLLAATTAHVGEAYNIGTGTSITIKRLGELIVEKTGASSAITHVAGRDGDIVHSRAEIAKAREHLGYEPSVRLEEGIEDLVE